MNYPSIKHAEVSWNEQGTPVSRTFDDIYFCNQNGMHETDYVFLKSNHLPGRFLTHPRALFIAAETGFGTGLNFLVLWQAFDQFRRDNPQARLQRLHFISMEKFPLTAADLAQAQEQWPSLSRLAKQLQQQWPMALAGCQRLLLDKGRVTLDLWFGDVNQLVDKFDDTLHRQVDAWFLDGFSPAKTPEMWTPQVFAALARLTRPQGTFATYTAAGFVRRGLTQAGFRVERRKGFAGKREMLAGVLEEAPPVISRTPWYHRPAASGDDIAIIGGGIASALLALALLRRKKRVTLYCADSAAAQGASGNRQAALYPLLSEHDQTLMQFFSTAFTFARRLYDALPATFAHDWCGVMQLSWDEKNRAKADQLAAMGLPDKLAQIVHQAQAESLAGVATGCGGISYPLGGWLSPAELTTTLFRLTMRQGLGVHWSHQLTQLDWLDRRWQLTFADGRQRSHHNLVLANGHALTALEQSAPLPVYPVAGQVSYFSSVTRVEALQQVLCYNGYLTPVSPTFGTHSIGASYRRGETATDYREVDQQENRLRLLRCLPKADWPSQVNISNAEARCSVRCVARDHLPLVGALPDYQKTLQRYAQLHDSLAAGMPISPAPLWPQLYVLGALGSRGVCSGPLAAEILAAQLCAEPVPADAMTLAALNPNRNWIRKLLKGKTVKR